MGKMDYDYLWKDVVEEFFEEFVLFFAPRLFEEIDFNKGYDFLEQELTQIYADAESEKKYMDKLAKVYLRDGKEKWILIHIEVQGNRKSNTLPIKYLIRTKQYWLNQIILFPSLS